MINAGEEIKIYADGKDGITTSKLKKNQEVELTIPSNGGVVIVN
jgi:hypothetical protein